MTDEQLLEQLRQANPVALEAVIYRYHAPIYAYTTRLLRHSHLAEDLTQECFARVCAAVREGRLPRALRPWLYAIATNLCKDLWKKASYNNEVPTESRMMSVQPDDQTVTSILDRQWEREEMIQLLSQLDGESRSIVILRYYEDLKLQEISDVVALPLSTVKWKLYRALKSLAQKMEGKEAVNDG